MSETIPQQHPAVVLRSHYRQLRTLLAVALVALLGMTTAVVVLALDDDSATTSTASQASQSLQGGAHFNARPDESSVAAAIAPPSPPAIARPDESKIAAAIAARHSLSTEPSRPDESTVAAAVSGK